MTGNPVLKRNPNWVVFFFSNERLWSCPTSLKPQRYLVDEIGTSDVTLRRSTSNCSKNLFRIFYALMLWILLVCWTKSECVVIPKFKVDFPKARNSVELGAFSSQAGSWRPFHLINRHLVPLMTTCIVEAGCVASCTQGQTKLYQFILSQFMTKKMCRETATWRLIPASITEGGSGSSCSSLPFQQESEIHQRFCCHWNLLGAFSNVMRIPVGNHFLSIEKPNNVWFTAKVTYDKMDARRLFGFQRCSTLFYITDYIDIRNIQYVKYINAFLLLLLRYIY